MTNKIILKITLIFFLALSRFLLNAEIRLKDDTDKLIVMKNPAKRIISLYSAHTENLFSLGLDKEIIGVYKNDNYPSQARSKKSYDYKSDPEKIIAANPDLVLIRPFIEKANPEFVKILEKVNINVVSLYPENFSMFEKYITKLGLLTGREENAKKLIAEFNVKIDRIKKITKDINPKVNVYFESTERNYRTVTNDSLPAFAIRVAGGINIANDVTPISQGSTIASYDAEKLLAKGEKIDIYIAQEGSMNSGITIEKILNRPGFKSIKAVKDGRIFIIDEKIISNPTFRFIDGIKNLAVFFYPELKDKI